MTLMWEALPSGVSFVSGTPYPAPTRAFDVLGHERAGRDGRASAVETFNPDAGAPVPLERSESETCHV